MTARRYAPDESWPRHHRSYWNEALADARSAGWTLNYVDAPHRFGDVFCPGDEDGTRHSFIVDKTARSGQFFSKEARKLVRGCHHGKSAPGARVRDRQRECERLLAQAEQLVTLAADGIALAEAVAAMWVEIDRIEGQLETAEANVVAILQEREEALLAAIDAEGVPDQRSISAALDDASAALNVSDSVATALRVRKPHLAKPFLDRTHQARGRIHKLRKRLRTLR